MTSLSQSLSLWLQTPVFWMLIAALFLGLELINRRMKPDCRHVAATPSRRLAAMDPRAEKLARHTGIVASSVAVRFNGLHDAAPPPQQII